MLYNKAQKEANMEKSKQKYRLVTRSDFDGLVCAVLLKELDLINDLKELGITSVFAESADLSNISDNARITDAKHSANIEFSNDGIKAASALGAGGAGDTIEGFDYLFDVPIEQIDLTFNKPYLFIIISASRA